MNYSSKIIFHLNLIKKKLNKYAPNEKLYSSIVHYQDLAKLLSDTKNFNDFLIAKSLLLLKNSTFWGEIIILN